MRSLYNLMRESEDSRDIDEFDNQYFDVMTLPINRFKTTIAPDKYILTQADINRFDLLIYTFYQTCDYDDIVLWYNNISFKEDLVVGQEIQLPNITDISNFYIKYLS